MKKLRAGVIGLGSSDHSTWMQYAVFLKRKLLPCVTIRQLQLSWSANNWLFPKRYTNWQDLIDDMKSMSFTIAHNMLYTMRSTVQQYYVANMFTAKSRLASPQLLPAILRYWLANAA